MLLNSRPYLRLVALYQRVLQRPADRARASRLGADQLQRPVLESLESRTLMAAALSGTIDLSKLPTTLVPGDKVTVPITITNTGNQTASGNIAINLYLSTDTQLDPQSDSLLSELSNKPLNLAAGASKTLQVKVTLPATAVAGNSFFLGQIDPGHVIDADGGLAQSSAVLVAHQFGEFDGRRRIKLTVQDGDDSLVTYSLNGPGSGQLVPAGGGAFNLVLTGTNEDSALSVKVKGGDKRAAIHDVTVHGSLKSISAAALDVSGNITFTATGDETGTVEAMTLGNIAANRLITIPGTGQTWTLKAGNVTQTSINSGSAIKSITINSWVGASSIAAPSIGSISADGDFSPNLTLSGAGVAADDLVLGSAHITGGIGNSVWSINGAGGTIDAGLIGPGWTGGFAGALKRLDVEGNAGGDIAAASFGSITIDGNLQSARLFPGTNFGADGHLGGGDDVVAAGSLKRLTVKGAADVQVRAGLDPDDGTFDDGDDQLLGTAANNFINTMSFGSLTSQSVIVAKALPRFVKIAGVKVDPTTDARFHTSTITQLQNPPAIIAALSQDTGSSSSDAITSNSAISGTLTHVHPLVSFRAGFDDAAVNDYVDVTADLELDGSFSFNATRLNQIFGSTLTNGSHTFHLRAVDDQSNDPGTANVTFTLDTVAPTTPTLALSIASDTGSLGDGHTTQSSVTLTGQTSPNTAVALLGTGLSTTSDQNGSFQFENVALTLGSNSLTVSATDAAGNLSTFDTTITRDAPAGINATATIASQQLDPSHYRYTITLHNTGTTNIGTFWYAWIISPSEADFLPVQPTATGSPSQWTALVSGGDPGNGYSIEWITASAPLAAGGTLSTFTFDTTATPAEIFGDSPFYPGTPVGRSVVYIGSAFGDPGLEFDVTPENS